MPMVVQDPPRARYESEPLWSLIMGIWGILEGSWGLGRHQGLGFKY